METVFLMKRDNFWTVIAREPEVVSIVTCLYYLRKNGAAARRGERRGEGGRLEQWEVVGLPAASPGGGIGGLAGGK